MRSLVFFFEPIVCGHQPPRHDQSPSEIFGQMIPETRTIIRWSKRRTRFSASVCIEVIGFMTLFLC